MSYETRIKEEAEVLALVTALRLQAGKMRGGRQAAEGYRKLREAEAIFREVLEQTIRNSLASQKTEERRAALNLAWDGAASAGERAAIQAQLEELHWGNA